MSLPMMGRMPDLDPAPLATLPPRGFGGDGAGPSQPKGI